MNPKVSDLIAEFLEERGIRHVFGIVGAGNVHIFDSITRKGFTEIVCVHHEQAACMAMQTYYRTSGRMAACVLTTGAGSTNAVTGVVSAWMDSIPGLVITGNESAKFTTEANPLRIWGVQGYDSVHMVKKVTKYATRVTEPTLIRKELDRAYDIALRGRPGPCWVEVPMSVQSATVDRAALAIHRPDESLLTPAAASGVDPNQAAEQVMRLLKAAKRPLLWLGAGIRHAGAVPLVETLLSEMKCPAIVSWAGIDMVDSHHPQVFGRAGVYGQRAANFILQNCDFLLTIGTRLAIPQVGYDLTEFARAAKIVVNDIDPAEACKHGARVNLAVVADAKAFIEALLRTAPAHSLEVPETWLEQCRNYRRKFPTVGPEHADREGFINSYPFMERLSDQLKPSQIVVTDMGTALLSGHQVLRLRKGQRLMTSLGLGEMGFGLPAAIGASFATDRGEVMCLNCDGGMMMNLQELQTIAHHRLPIKLIIFNNDGYLMIKHTQTALFEGRYSGVEKRSGLSCPDFSALAKVFDFTSYQIRTWEDFDQVIPRLQEQRGPGICEVFMHPEQKLVPKLSLWSQKDGTLLSPPLEDLYPLISREDLREAMLIGMHPKSEKLVP